MSATAATIGTPDGQPIPEPSPLANLFLSIWAVLVKESRWRMRGRRAFVVVTIYVALVALLVFGVQRLVHDSFVNRFDDIGGSADLVSGFAAAAIGQAIFTTILAVQTMLTLLVAPALTSGAISSEREKQTLELLITTPASTLGMVVGKLFSSLAYVLLLTLASVPLMSIVFAFGGIAPDDVVRAYVLLLAVAFGIGSIGLFMSALLKRSQVSTALSYVIVFALTFGSLILHTFLLASAARFVDDRFVEPGPPPEMILWLNPLVADLDLLCTAIPDSFGVTCAYTGTITGAQINPANPPRDAFWPRSAAAFILVGVGLTLATTQLIAPSRRIRRPARSPSSVSVEPG